MDQPLAIALCLFESLEKAGVRHCQWKSNQHLAEALSGQTDIDLLVDKAQATQCERILTGLAYKRFQSQPWTRYPGIEDWLGFDEQTGKLVQIHLHYQHLSGTKFVKQQHLPWEKLILDTAVLDTTYGVRITDPSLEMLLLIVRIGLKTSYSQLARGLIGRRILPGDLVEEFDYLLERIDPETTRRYAAGLLGAECSEAVGEIIRRGSPSDPRAIWRIKAQVNRVIKEHRRFTGVASLVYTAQRRVHSLAARVLRKLDNTGQAGKRLHSGGAIIAVLGSDGSGKSTVSREIQKWLSWKVDSHHFYFGTGDGAVGAPVKLAKRVAGMQGRKTTASPGSAQGDSGKKQQKRSFLREMGSRFLGVTIAADRRRKVLKANRVRLNGGVIIADRYPQNQFVGIYDGPRAGEIEGRGSGAVGLLARRELDIYDRIGEFAPDIVIKLHVPEEIAQSRKPEHKIEEIRRKAKITSELEFPRSRVIDVDASQPLECVVLTVKKQVWNAL